MDKQKRLSPIDTHALKKGISSSLCKISLVSLQHTSLIVNWRNDPENSRWFAGTSEFTAEGHEAWLRRQNETDTNFNWIVETRDSVAVGMVSLYDIDFNARSGEFGRLLIGDKNSLRKGLGKEITALILQLAFNAGLERIYLYVKQNNERAIKLYESMDFTRAGNSNDLISMEIYHDAYREKFEASYD